MKIKGDEQGLITQGAGEQEEHEDEILVLAYSHRIKRSGEDKGPRYGYTTHAEHRIHLPLSITKNIDKSSPLLYSAMCRGENLNEVLLRLYQPSLVGTLENFFTIKLENALISDIQSYMPHCYDSSKTHFRNCEEISFVYQRITWTHETESTTAADSWRPRGDGDL